MMTFSLLLCCTLAADPSPEQLRLLKTFREEFISITPGVGKYPKSFRMGWESGGQAELPTHTVTFNYPFAVAKYEVPQNLWTSVMGKNPSRWQGARNSVEMLSLAEAQEFCQKATQLLHAAKLIAAEEVIRLPTEAEWEYVARAGTSTVYSFGDDKKDLDNYAWSTQNAKGNDPPVGAKLPNPWGLYDVHGYLSEWCSDGWHDNYDSAPTDGSAWSGSRDDRGVARSGSWKDGADKLTSSYRQPFPRDARDDALGLRCILAKPR